MVGFFVATILISADPKSFLSNIFGNSRYVELRDPHTGGDLADAEGPQKDIGYHASHEGAHAHENKTLAKQLHNDVRVLCWIMTSPKNHQKKARHVKRTWGSRCNKILFMSSVHGNKDFYHYFHIQINLIIVMFYSMNIDDEIDSVALPVKEGRNNLWAKTKEAFKYIYEHHLNDADWFLKADDDTYVIMENLRYMLYPYSASYPIYFGCKFKPFVKQVLSTYTHILRQVSND